MSDSPRKDADVESAKEDLATEAPTGSSDGEQPTVEEQGTMTPDQEAVEEANASGVDPDN